MNVKNLYLGLFSGRSKVWNILTTVGEAQLT